MLLAFGINFFLVPFELIDGGVIGIGLIINYLTDVKAGLVIIVLSIPIFALAWFYNKKYFYNSLHGMLVSSFIIDLLSPTSDIFMIFNDDPFISAILGGVFVGCGIGFMLRYETSTGGTDLLAQFFSELFKINVGLTIFIIDALVICLGALFLSSGNILLSILTIICVGICTIICTWDMQQAV